MKSIVKAVFSDEVLERIRPCYYARSSGSDSVRGDPTPRLRHNGDEYGVSQVFIAWNIETVHGAAFAESITTENSRLPAYSGTCGKRGWNYYPGEQTLRSVDNLKRHLS